MWFAKIIGRVFKVLPCILEFLLFSFPKGEHRCIVVGLVLCSVYTYQKKSELP